MGFSDVQRTHTNHNNKEKTDVFFYCGAHYSEIRLESSPLLFFYFYENFIQRLNLNNDEANQYIAQQPKKYLKILFVVIETIPLSC